MKKVFLILVLSSGLGLVAGAQVTNNKSTGVKKQSTKTKLNRTTASGSSTESTHIVRSVSSSSNEARAGASNSQSAAQLSISDPTINALNARANGNPVMVSSSGIVGMSKHAYGFANGHLTLYSSGATSTGTSTGSGAVGTGTSLGNIGASGPGMAINGKSPYAGSNMWGNATRMTVRYGDSTVRVTGY
jgi:hypothetical protein